MVKNKTMLEQEKQSAWIITAGLRDKEFQTVSEEPDNILIVVAMLIGSQFVFSWTPVIGFLFLATF